MKAWWKKALGLGSSLVLAAALTCPLAGCGGEEEPAAAPERTATPEAQARAEQLGREAQEMAEELEAEAKAMQESAAEGAEEMQEEAEEAAGAMREALGQ